MSTAMAMQAHIAYELIEETNHQLVIVEFLSHDITSPAQRENLQSNFIRCFGVNHASILSSTARASGHWGVRRLVKSYPLSRLRDRCGFATSIGRYGSERLWSAWTIR